MAVASLMIPVAARDHLLECLGADGQIIPGSKFLAQLDAQELILADVLCVLRTGVMIESAQLDVRTGEWNYTIEGTDPDGRRLAVAFGFRQVNRAALVSVSLVEGRSFR